jgi:ligand-binding sensor domain-containing protein
VTTAGDGRDGSLWISTYGGGLLRFKDGKFTRYMTRESLSDDQVRTVYEDRAGRLWIGTFGQGVSVLEGGRFIRHAVKDGLAHANVKSIQETRSTCTCSITSPRYSAAR